MNDIQTRVMLEDMQNEFQWRLQLRDALSQALALLTNPDSDEFDANRVIALINQTLEETAP